jgi:hypothetical protein
LPPKPQTVYIDIISRKRGKVNMEEKQMEESKPAVWNPDKAPEGVFCPTCGSWIDDYTGQPEKCPKCGQKLSGWIDGRKHPPELHKTK